MEAFGIYSLKAGVILALFWVIYQFFLQKETFYRFNRFFLLIGFMVALLLPLYTIHYTVEVKMPDIPMTVIYVPENISPATESMTGEVSAPLKYGNSLLPVIYMAVIIILMIIRTIGLSRLLRIIHCSERKRFSGFNLIESSDISGSFSFFRFIFLPKNLNESEKGIILIHEETHIVQNHWIDLILTNILTLIWWFNPFMWIYEKAIRNNHEYLADKEVLKRYEQTDFQQTLVNQWFKYPVFPIINSFAYSDRLKRINMMKKNFSNPAKKLFSLIAIPAIAIFLWACSERNTIIDTNSELMSAPVSTPEETVSMDNNSSGIRQEGKIFKEGGFSMFNGEFTVIKSKSGRLSLEGCDEPPLIVMDDKITKMTIDDLIPENIHSISTIASEEGIKRYGDVGKYGVLILTTKSYKKDAISDVKSRTSASTSIKDNPVQEKSSTDKNLDISSASATVSQKHNEISNNRVPTPKFTVNSPIAVSNDKGRIDFKNDPLIIIDDKKVSNAVFSSIHADAIQSITILKDQIAIAAYGEEAKNGAVIITTKNGR